MKRKDPLKNLTNQTRANVSFLMMSSPNGTISSNVALNRRKLRKLLFTHYLKGLIYNSVEELRYSWSLGIALAIASKRSFLFSSSFLRLNATLEHLGEQYQDVMVFATNGSPQILHFLVISNFAAPIQFYLIITYVY